MIRPKNAMACLIVIFLAHVLFVGCEPRRDAADSNGPPSIQQRLASKSSPFVADETEYVVLVVVDLSASFSGPMADDGIAFQFLQRVLTKYFKDRVGSNTEKLVIAQIGGTSHSLLWSGSPVAFKRRFSTPASLRVFLHANANPNGSFVNEAISSALDHLMRIPNVANGRAKSVLLVLSDLDDNGENRELSEQRLLESLVSFIKTGGHCGFYFCDEGWAKHWIAKLSGAGYPLVPVLAKADEIPTLPDFQE